MKKIIITILLLLILVACDEFNYNNLVDTDVDLAEMTGDLEIIQLTDSSVKLTWQANEDVIDKYIIERKVNSEGSYEIHAEVEAPATEFVDEGLLISNNYYYKVTGANDENMTNTLWSNIRTNFAEIDTFSVEQKSITTSELKWEHSCNYESGYVVERREISQTKADLTSSHNNGLRTRKKSTFTGEMSRSDNLSRRSSAKTEGLKTRDGYEVIATLPANSNSFLDDTLIPNHVYEYKIKAVSEFNESSYTDETQISMIFPAPTDLEIEQTGNTECHITWNYNGFGDETGFILERRLSGGNWQNIAELAINEMQFTDSGLTEGESYEYMVFAYNQVLSGNTTTAIIAMQTIPEEGLVAFYPFNGNENDESGNGYNGENYGATPCEDRFGNTESAYDFDGDDNYIELNNSEEIYLNSWTISVWIKIEGYTDNYGAIIGSQENNSYKYNFQMLVREEFKVASQYETATSEEDHTLNSPDLDDNVWYHFTSIRDESTGAHKIYVDGNEVNNGMSNDTPVNTNELILIGARSSNQKRFIGIIDDIRIYNRALTEEEIDALYHEGGWDE